MLTPDDNPRPDALGDLMEARGRAKLSETRAAAGRIGARRSHELERLGLLYEQEHGLKAGIQRRKQLRAMGRRYEQEHGTAPPKKIHRKRCRDPLGEFLAALARLVKAKHRGDVERLIAAAVAALPPA